MRRKPHSTIKVAGSFLLLAAGALAGWRHGQAPAAQATISADVETARLPATTTTAAAAPRRAELPPVSAQDAPAIPAPQSRNVSPVDAPRGTLTPPELKIEFEPLA